MRQLSVCRKPACGSFSISDFVTKKLPWQNPCQRELFYTQSSDRPTTSARARVNPFFNSRFLSITKNSPTSSHERRELAVFRTNFLCIGGDLCAGGFGPKIVRIAKSGLALDNPPLTRRPSRERLAASWQPLKGRKRAMEYRHGIPFVTLGLRDFKLIHYQIPLAWGRENAVYSSYPLVHR